MANISDDDDDDDYDNHSNNDYDSEIKFRNGKPTEDRSEKQFAPFITFVSCYKYRGYYENYSHIFFLIKVNIPFVQGHTFINKV